MMVPMRNGNFTARFDYADGIGILGFGAIVIDLAATLRKEVENITNFPH